MEASMCWYVYGCCQYHVVADGLVSSATSGVIVAVVVHTVALTMVAALTAYAATAGLDLPTVRLVFTFCFTNYVQYTVA